MSDIFNICLFCLCKNNNLKNEFYLDESNDVIKQMTFVLPELVISELEVPVHICSLCHKTLHSFYTFKKMCLDNYNYLTNDILQKTKNPVQIFSEFVREKPKMNNNLSIQEEVEASQLLSKKQDGEEICSEDNINVKEQIDSVQTKSQNNYPASASDNDESNTTNHDSQSIFDQNMSNKSRLLTSLLKCADTKQNDKKFKCVICNQQFSTNYFLAVHVKMHLGIKNVINNKKNASKHKITRKRNRYIKCPLCTKQFIKKKNLNCHLQYHAGMQKFRHTYNLRTKIRNKNVK